MNIVISLAGTVFGFFLNVYSVKKMLGPGDTAEE